MSKYFVGAPNQPRARRATDAILIFIGLVLLTWTSALYGEISTVDQWFIDLLEPLPDWFVDVWSIGYFLGILLVLAIVAGAIRNKRRDLLRDIALAVVAALAIGVGLALLVSDAFPTVFPEISDVDATAFPILRVAVVAAVIAVASPDLTRPVRLVGWGIVVLVALSGFGIGLGLPTDAVGAVGIGLVAAGSILLIFGSPKGYPDLEAVEAALAELGVIAGNLSLVPTQSWGVRTLSGTIEDSTPIEVLAYGRDAADTRMAAKFWHTLWYRESDITISFSRLESVEHNALAGLMAADSGVHTQKLLAVGIAGDDMAVLARTAVGTPLTEPSQEEAEAVWRELLKLHNAGISHGSSTFDTATVDNGRIVLGDFANASFNATPSQRSLDIVSLLYDTAALLGAESAVEAAEAVAPNEDLIEAIAYLQVPALSPEQRDRVGKPKALVKEIREAAVKSTGAEPSEPAKLRRIRPKDLFMPALSLFAIFALLGMLADIDFAAVWAVIEDASWILFVIAFLIAHLAFFSDATGMLFATGYPLPMKPLVVLQLGVRWIGLAVPSVAGRVGMNTAFLRRYGVPPTEAVTQGAVDSLSNFLIQAVVLLVAFIAVKPPLDIDTGDVNWGLVILLVVVVIVGSVIAVFRIRRLHDAVIPVFRSAWDALSGVAKSPKRAFGLLGSNLASMLLQAGALWLILESIDTPVALVTALVVVVATSLLGGLVPIPGGVGVSEAVMTSFLVMAGVDQNSAFAASVVWRVCTFYVPAAEGFFATKWLERGDYI